METNSKLMVELADKLYDTISSAKDEWNVEIWKFQNGFGMADSAKTVRFEHCKTDSVVELERNNFIDYEFHLIANAVLLQLKDASRLSKWIALANEIDEVGRKKKDADAVLGIDNFIAGLKK